MGKRPHYHNPNKTPDICNAFFVVIIHTESIYNASLTSAYSNIYFYNNIYKTRYFTNQIKPENTKVKKIYFLNIIKNYHRINTSDAQMAVISVGTADNPRVGRVKIAF